MSVDVSKVSLYLKIDAVWMRDTAKGLLAVCGESTLVDVKIEEISSGKYMSVTILNQPSTFSRSVNCNTLVGCLGESKGICFSLVGKQFLGIVSKIIVKKGDLIGLRLYASKLYISVISENKRSDINYEFAVYGKHGSSHGFDRGNASCAMVQAWPFLDVMKRIKKIKDGSISGTSGLLIVFDGKVDNAEKKDAITFYAYNNNMSLMAEVGAVGAMGKGKVCLDLGAAHDIHGACTGVNDEDMVVVSIGKGVLIERTRSELNGVDLFIQDKLGASEGIVKVFSAARSKVRSQAVVNAEKLKGAMERLCIISKGNPDNANKIHVDVIAHRGRIKFSCASPGNSGSEMIEADVSFGEENCYVNAGKLSDILKGSDYSENMVVSWGGNVMQFEWDEVKDEVVIMEVEGKKKKVSVPAYRVHYRALLALMKG